MSIIVDRIFIINLKSRPDKYLNIVKQLHHFNITNYERFDAIKPNIEMISENKYLDALYRKTWEQAALGVIGCKLSHIEVIKIAKERGYKSILILEDDALFLENFSNIIKKVANQLSEIPGWQLLYLGANHRKKGERVTENIKRCFEAYTTSSYIVHHSVYDVIINRAIKSITEIDTFYVKDIQKNYLALAVFPNIITQMAGISDISGNHTDVEFGEC